MEIDLTANTAPAGTIKDSDTSQFAVDVIQASMEKPVIVDFWAPWCGPCKQLTPVLEKVVTQAGGSVALVKIDIDTNQQLAQQLRVQSVPTVMAFQNGQPVDAFMGALPESQVKAFVEKLTGALGPSPVDQLLEHAEGALAAGNGQEAGQIYSQILQAEPDNLAAIAGLAKALINLGDLDGAGQTLEAAPQGQTSPELDGAKAALELARQSQEAGDIEPLKAAVEANPKDHQARFDLAVALNAGGDHEGAVEHLLEIIAADKNWNEQAARQQLLTFFEAYGPTHELTLSGRRRLSSLLFS